MASKTGILDTSPELVGAESEDGVVGLPVGAVFTAVDGFRLRGFHRFTSNRSYQLLGEAEEHRGMNGQWL